MTVMRDAPTSAIVAPTKSAMSGSGAGSMSWRTISASASDGVFTRSTEQLRDPLEAAAADDHDPRRHLTRPN